MFRSAQEHTMNRYPCLTALAALAGLALTGCSTSHDANPPATPTQLPQLTQATGATLSACADLASRIAYPDTTITAVNPVAAGVLAVGGKPVPAHCQVLGQMFRRTGPVDGKAYAIGFELRLPVDWNGRFFYQANGGVDGSVVAATGPVGGGGPLDSALSQGFAVLSSDAGHGAPRRTSASTRRRAWTMAIRPSASSRRWPRP